MKQANEFFFAYFVLTKFGHQFASNGFHPSFLIIINFFFMQEAIIKWTSKDAKSHML
jgi:hypothetical protein